MPPPPPQMQRGQRKPTPGHLYGAKIVKITRPAVDLFFIKYRPSAYLAQDDKTAYLFSDVKRPGP